MLPEPREIQALQKDPCDIRNPSLDIIMDLYVQFKKSEDRQLLEA